MSSTLDYKVKNASISPNANAPTFGKAFLPIVATSFHVPRRVRIDLKSFWKALKI